MNERIRARRKKLKLSQENVANHIGVNRVSVSNWETDENAMPKGENLLKLAEVLRVAPQWLISGAAIDDTDQLLDEVTSEASKLLYESMRELREIKGEGFDPRFYFPSTGSGKTSTLLNTLIDLATKDKGENVEQIVLGGFDLWDSGTPLNDDEVALPFYREIELSAGSGSTLVKEDTTFKLRFAKSTLRKLSVNASDAACVTVAGNSMEPALNNGATVGIDTSKKNIVDGKMYAVDHGGMLRVKMLYRLPGGVKLRSFNMEEHPDEVVAFSEIRIIGRVFWSSNFH